MSITTTTTVQEAPKSPTVRSPESKRRKMRHRIGSRNTTDDADAAAGILTRPLIPSAPSSGKSELEFFEDLISEPVLVLGMDISHLSRKYQFIVCATGVFCFSLLYGFLQELISVNLCNRELGLFLATLQFTGYTFWSFLLRTYVYEKQKKATASQMAATRTVMSSLKVPIGMYLGLSLLRAVDLGMTNVAMKYINYPAKTLMKSSRVVFTMLFGVLVSRKKYRPVDYLVVALMVSGLAIFMHADASSSAVFHHLGVIMLTTSLMCDGAISNMSEKIMNQFGVGQDEFIFNMYSIALVAIAGAATYRGDMQEGIRFLFEQGTYGEIDKPLEDRDPRWTPGSKMFVIMLFSTMGFFGSSCSAAITKNFGALTMSITSTARKATTLFLSFLLFDNECTLQHVSGIFLFICALVCKSLRASKKKRPSTKAHASAPPSAATSLDLEIANDNGTLRNRMVESHVV